MKSWRGGTTTASRSTSTEGRGGGRGPLTPTSTTSKDDAEYNILGDDSNSSNEDRGGRVQSFDNYNQYYHDHNHNHDNTTILNKNNNNININMDTIYTSNETNGNDENNYNLYFTDNSEARQNQQNNKNTYSLPWLRSKCGQIVNNTQFQKIIIILIALNSITMGIATFDFITQNEIHYTIFEIIDRFFLILFSFELSLQFIYLGFHLFTDGWLVFDFVVIVLSWMSESMQVVRAFRILRASRIIMRVQSMKDIVEALINVTPRIFAVACLLLLIFYIYAVMVTSLFKTLYEDGYLDEDYFGRLDISFFTLFQIMTMDSWSSITKQVQVVYPWAWALFITFVLISSFIIVNLVIAVICDAVSEVQRKEIEDQVKMAGSEMSEKNAEKVDVLEKKIDDLTILVERLLTHQEGERLRITNS